MSTSNSFDLCITKVNKVHRQKLSKGKAFYYITLSENYCKRLGISEGDHLSQEVVPGGIMLRVVRKSSFGGD